MFRAIHLVTTSSLRTAIIPTLIGMGLYHKRKQINDWLTGVDMTTNWTLRNVYLANGRGGGGSGDGGGPSGVKSGVGGPSGGGGGGGRTLTVKEIVNLSFPHVVSVRQEIENTDPDKDNTLFTTASGFRVIVKGKDNNDKGFIITTARAVGNSNVVILKMSETNEVGGNENVVDGTVVYINAEHDIAIVRPNNNITSGLQLAINLPLKASNPVVIAGHSWDYKTVNKGVISWPNRMGHEICKIGKKYELLNNNIAYIQHTASFAVDDYGGPLMNMEGKVIGMYFYLQLIDNIVMYYAIPSYYINEAINKALEYSDTTPQKKRKKRINPKVKTGSDSGSGSEGKGDVKGKDGHKRIKTDDPYEDPSTPTK
ncbi:serine protease HTRA3-like [Oppia nitens]|uniref:serine protease HTRA3-like n=1 Tax=Oppia nitens TaxID=1686743 RepID=UPI0023DC453B|nr:serine protease HTRA3-like [Oppia nitens]